MFLIPALFLDHNFLLLQHVHDISHKTYPPRRRCPDISVLSVVQLHQHRLSYCARPAEENWLLHHICVVRLRRSQVLIIHRSHRVYSGNFASSISADFFLLELLLFFSVIDASSDTLSTSSSIMQFNYAVNCSTSQYSCPCVLSFTTSMQNCTISVLSSIPNFSCSTYPSSQIQGTLYGRAANTTSILCRSDSP